MAGTLVITTDQSWTASSDPPVWDTPDDLGTVDVDEPFSFVVTASDPEGGVVYYRAVSIPEGTEFDPITHTISSDGLGAAGVYEFDLEASDSPF